MWRVLNLASATWCITWWITWCVVAGNRHRHSPPEGHTSDWPQRNHEASVVAYLKEKSEYYGTASRPLDNQSEPIRVNISLRLIQVDVSEPLNTLTTSVWVKQIWYDKYMTWNESDFNGVKVVVIPSSWVWLPDVSLVNTAETDINERAADLLIYNTGGIYWLTHKVFKSACLFDVTDYPFDRQQCHLWFQSLSYQSSRLDPVPVTFDLDTYLSDFKRADEWEIIGSQSLKVRKPRDLGEMLMFSTRVTLRFSLTLKRRAGFQAYLLTLPCIVLGSLSILVFSLPPERPDRHALATSLLGSFIMLLMVLVSTAPPSAASIPKLGLFYAFNICIIVLSLCLSAMVINVSKLGDKGCRVPRIIEKIFLKYLATLLMMRMCRPQAEKRVNSSLEDPREESVPEKLAVSQSFSNGKLVGGDPVEQDGLLCRKRRTGDDGETVVANNTCEPETPSSGDDGLPVVADTPSASSGQGGNNTNNSNNNSAALVVVGQSLSRLVVTLRSIESLVEKLLHLKETPLAYLRQTEEQIKWKAVGAVMDRLFMVIYIIVICASLTFLLPRAHTI